MFVRRQSRRQDLSRRLLEQLEREAAERGYESCRLETGIRQPEAMALYRSAGYEEMDCFGAYRDAPLSRCFERRTRRLGLGPQPSGSGRGGRMRGTTSTATIAVTISTAPSHEMADRRSSASR